MIRKVILLTTILFLFTFGEKYNELLAQGGEDIYYPVPYEYDNILVDDIYLYNYYKSVYKYKGAEKFYEISGFEIEISQLEDIGLPIYLGDDPPMIQGTYLLESFLNIYNETNKTNWTTTSYKFNFQNQEEKNIELSYFTIEDDSDYGKTKQGENSIILGENNNFTVFTITESVTNMIPNDLLIVCSGSIKNKKLIEFYVATIILKKEGDSNNYYIIAPNSKRLFKLENKKY